jgi:hypothetical protein
MTLFTKKKFQIHILVRYFMSDNEPNGIKIAPHNIFSKKAGHFNFSSQLFRKYSVGLIFIPLGSLSLVKYPVLYTGSQFFQLLGRAYCSTIWLAIVLSVNSFLNTIFSLYRNCICFLFSIASSISCMREANRIFSFKLYGVFILQKN